jgi:hypothetical protein
MAVLEGFKISTGYKKMYKMMKEVDENWLIRMIYTMGKINKFISSPYFYS